MPGGARGEGRRAADVKQANGIAARRAHAALEPPPGTEARLVEVGGEELLVFRVPLKRIALHESLSDAEREVAALALAGLSNSEIGRRRGTSGRTVANQMATIFRKLGVGSRSELALNVVVKGGR
jgi:DNA-binding CsgD family transcriptional regulator